MLILICGSREWTDEDAIRHEILRFDPAVDVIMHGAARGADRIAGAHAEALGFKVRKFLAQWDRYGKSAGVFRNQQMLNQNPDLVLAFTPDLEKSRGTAHMVRIARAKGVRVEVFNA